jgi:hypothetical protein
MGNQHDNPNALSSAWNQPRRRKGFLLSCGVSLLAGLSAAVLMASFVEQVRDTADRTT